MMIGQEAKKAAITAYKERPPSAGIYRIYCPASGENWVGAWSTLETIQNRHWFALRLGTHPNASLQQAWGQYGADQIQFEILERLDQTASAYVRTTLLKERALHWRTALGARAI